MFSHHYKNPFKTPIYISKKQVYGIFLLSTLNVRTGRETEAETISLWVVVKLYKALVHYRESCMVCMTEPDYISIERKKIIDLASSADSV